ncbi:MAG TPA: hypothetical protein RMH99_11190 [Sandaracinaceae bacterium LLY-WYZ-13_1]|nr:hypothetical protein [Sandaracinaceae bacterium LLY-WYZ-13_1]
MSSERDQRPFIVLTAILDGSARPAAVTVSHGDAMERAIGATAGTDIAGLDIVELPVAPPAFGALRKHSGRAADACAVYDLFPLAATLDPQVRTIAGQFLAAEALWALEEAGHLEGVPLNLKLDVPKGWDRDPKKIHEKLVAAGALELSSDAIETFKSIKGAWDAQP